MAAVSASPHSLLAYLTPAELRQGVSARNISFFRPATVPATGLEEQLVPRVIMQTGSTWDRALRKNAQYIHSWLDLNPEYEYNFFSDEHAWRFVQLHGNAGEKDAYRRILTGSQRADVFRVLYLRIAGGVYADLDEELRRPLNQLFSGTDVAGRKVPGATATAVIGTFWPFEFLLFVPDHPILVHATRIMTEGIMQQVEWFRSNSTHRCRGAHECIIRVTGPLAYTSAVGAATMGECKNRVRLPHNGQCDRNAKDPLLRNMFLCEKDAGTIWNSWSCGFARHWDCRNSDRRRNCGAKHYGVAKHFFALD